MVLSMKLTIHRGSWKRGHCPGIELLDSLAQISPEEAVRVQYTTQAPLLAWLCKSTTLTPTDREWLVEEVLRQVGVEVEFVDGFAPDRG